MDPRHTCHICGFRASLRWVEYLAGLARLVIPPGHKLGAVIVRCEECGPRPPVVLHHCFRPGVDFWTAQQEGSG